MLWRQGDIFIETAGGIPTGAIRKAEPVLAEGELTGHFHRAEDDSAAAVFDHRGILRMPDSVAVGLSREHLLALLYVFLANQHAHASVRGFKGFRARLKSQQPAKRRSRRVLRAVEQPGAGKMPGSDKAAVRLQNQP